MATIEDLRTELEADTDQVSSVITLIERLADEVQHNLDDPEALQEVVNGMRANRDALAAAVAANIAGSSTEPGATTEPGTGSTNTTTEPGTGGTDVGSEPPVTPTSPTGAVTEGSPVEGPATGTA